MAVDRLRVMDSVADDAKKLLENLDDPANMNYQDLASTIGIVANNIGRLKDVIRYATDDANKEVTQGLIDKLQNYLGDEQHSIIYLKIIIFIIGWGIILI